MHWYLPPLGCNSTVQCNQGVPLQLEIIGSHISNNTNEQRREIGSLHVKYKHTMSQLMNPTMFICPLFFFRTTDNCVLQRVHLVFVVHLDCLIYIPYSKIILSLKEISPCII